MCASDHISIGGRGKSRVTYESYTQHTMTKIKNNNGRSIVYTRKLHSISENISKIVTEDKIICIFIIVVYKMKKFDQTGI